MKKLGILAVLCLFTVACAQHTSVRQHESYADLARDISTVVIVPPEVEIELIAFDGDNEKLTDDQERISAEITELARQRLTEEGLTVIDFDIALAMAEDEEFAYNVTQCTEAWNSAKAELYTTGLVSEDKKSSFQTTLGPVVNAIAEKTGAESLLLMHYSGAKKSAGMIAKDVGTSILIGVLTAGAVVPVQATEGASIDVALIETTEGKVVWSNRKALQSVDSSLAKMALHELPDVEWENELAAKAESAAVVADAAKAEADTTTTAEENLSAPTATELPPEANALQQP